MQENSLRARNVMQLGVITIPADARLEAAVRTFEDHRISGCPVIDRVGKVVGVISASDVANSSRLEDGQLAASQSTYYWASASADLFEDQAEPEEFLLNGFNSDTGVSVTVQDLMTPRVVSVDPDAPLDQVCKTMVEERVHRVLVTEEDSLVGIISSFDIVRAMAGTPAAATE